MRIPRRIARTRQSEELRLAFEQRQRGDYGLDKDYKDYLYALKARASCRACWGVTGCAAALHLVAGSAATRGDRSLKLGTSAWFTCSASRV